MDWKRPTNELLDDSIDKFHKTWTSQCNNKIANVQANNIDKQHMASNENMFKLGRQFNFRFIYTVGNLLSVSKYPYHDINTHNEKKNDGVK